MSRSFSIACAKAVTCSPRTASWAVRPYAFADPIASDTRSPPKTRPVPLAPAKTATSRMDTGQLLSESRIGREAARCGFLLVCRLAFGRPAGGVAVFGLPAFGRPEGDVRVAAAPALPGLVSGVWS